MAQTLIRMLIESFKVTLEDLRLREISLNGRRFTWSNEQDNSTITRIDRPKHTRVGSVIFFTHRVIRNYV